MTDSLLRVAGRCPMGCGETLFLGLGGHVTCSLIGCPDPCAADRLLYDGRIHVRYNGDFALAWLRDGSRVSSAGDGTGAAIVISPDGSERRIDVGDEIVVPL